MLRSPMASIRSSRICRSSSFIATPFRTLVDLHSDRFGDRRVLRQIRLDAFSELRRGERHGAAAELAETCGNGGGARHLAALTIVRVSDGCRSADWSDHAVPEAFVEIADALLREARDVRQLLHATCGGDAERLDSAGADVGNRERRGADIDRLVLV